MNILFVFHSFIICSRDSLSLSPFFSFSFSSQADHPFRSLAVYKNTSLKKRIKKHYFIFSLEGKTTRFSLTHEEETKVIFSLLLLTSFSHVFLRLLRHFHCSAHSLARIAASEMEWKAREKRWKKSLYCSH